MADSSQSGQYKTIKIEPILKLLQSVRKLVATASRDPRYGTLTSEVVSDLIDASGAISQASQTRIVVDVPPHVMDTLNQIQTETKDMQKLLLQLQGMLISQEAHKNPPTGSHFVPQYAHQRAYAYGQRREHSTTGDSVQALLEMMQGLSSQGNAKTPHESPFPTYYPK